MATGPEPLPKDDNMTSPEPNSTALSGEARLRQRSRRIRNIWIGALGFAFIAGAGFGLAEGSGTLQLSPLVFWLFLAALAAGVVAVNVWFMRGVDEVEVMDNLWAGFAGLNAHIVIGAGWIAAASRGFAPAPNVPGVMAATLVVTLLAYGALKLRRRLG
jgi:hypothetical protein